MFPATIQAEESLFPWDVPRFSTKDSDVLDSTLGCLSAKSSDHRRGEFADSSRAQLIPSPKLLQLIRTPGTKCTQPVASLPTTRGTIRAQPIFLPAPITATRDIRSARTHQEGESDYDAGAKIPRPNGFYLLNTTALWQIRSHLLPVNLTSEPADSLWMSARS